MLTIYNISKKKNITKQEAIKKVSEDEFFLKKLSDEFKNSPEIVLAAVAHSNGGVLQFASAELRNNKVVVLFSVSKQVKNIEFFRRYLEMIKK